MKKIADTSGYVSEKMQKWRKISILCLKS